MSGKNLALKLNAEMFSANQITGFLSFNISKTIGVIKLISLHAGTYLLNLQIDDVTLGECGQACSGMTIEAIKT